MWICRKSYAMCRTDIEVLSNHAQFIRHHTNDPCGFQRNCASDSPYPPPFLSLLDCGLEPLFSCHLLLTRVVLVLVPEEVLVVRLAAVPYWLVRTVPRVRA